jgi:hypothetical protein
MKICRSAYPLVLSLGILVTACIEPYPAPVVDGDINYLVVDGSVDGLDGTATVTLSHAVPLASTEPPPPELDAEVSLEDNNGNTYTLTEIGNGVYTQTGLPVDDNKEYRLHIRTTDNSEYRSDFVTIKETPEIDSLTWAPTAQRDGIEIRVNTHDATKNTRYYQWSFEETYQYEAPYYAFLRLEGEEVVPIPLEEQTFNCWRTIVSKNILIASSERLNEDIISNFPITFIEKGAQKISVKYSILVKQRALSREAYDYWLNLQKTTENLGGLFDPQPGRVTGNIHNVNYPDYPVLGYFDIGTSKEQRLFINSTTIPNDLRGYKLTSQCEVDTVLLADLPLFPSNSSTLLDPVQGMGPFIIGYRYTTNSCADCRHQNGTTTKPPFWQ